MTFAVILAGGAFMSGVVLVTLQHPHVSKPAAILTTQPKSFTLSPNTLQADAAAVYDLTTGRVLFAKNAEQSLPLASLTKLMTALVVLDHTLPGTKVVITAEDLAPEGDWGLRVGDTLSVPTLLKLSLVASSNDAITAAARSLGSNYLAQMNLSAQKLGLTHTRFLDPTGLDIDEKTAGAYGSAEDVARLVGYFYKRYPQYMTLSSQRSISVSADGRELTASATAAPILAMPGLIGAKTGYTILAGGNLVVLFDLDIGHPVAVVVLGSTQQSRFSDVETLIRTTREVNTKKI